MTKSLRHLKIDKGVTRLAAAEVRHLMQKPVARRNKYSAQAIEADGYRFASLRERDAYFDLKMRLRAGDITDLELQPRYPLVVNGIAVATYVADFRFRERDGQLKVLDAKGVKTAVYRIKRKLMQAVHGVTVEEV